MIVTTLAEVPGKKTTKVLGLARGNTIRARHIIVATNGYTGTATPWLQKRIVPIPSQIIATDSIPKETMDRLMPKRRMLGETRNLYHYFRPSPDGTGIVFGGRAGADQRGAEHDQLAGARYVGNQQVLGELHVARQVAEDAQRAGNHYRRHVPSGETAHRAQPSPAMPHRHERPPLILGGKSVWFGTF